METVWFAVISLFKKRGQWFYPLICILRSMLKKCAGLFLFTIATLILLGHNLVPHHHHHLHQETASHHHHNTNNTDGEDQNVLGHFFSNVLHDTGVITFIGNDVTPTFPQKAISIAGILPDSHVKGIFTVPPLLLFPRQENHFGYSVLHRATGLRGPPVLFA